MWAQQLTGPGLLTLVDVPDGPSLRPGQVRLRFLAGAICGSDLPKFLGGSSADLLLGGAEAPDGYPLHEVVGEVVETRADGFAVGDRAVGMCTRSGGMAAYFVNDAATLHVLTGDLDDVAAVVAQPIATVLSALDRLPSVAGRHAAVIGLGPLGLLIAHALKARGAATVTGVDRVDRRDVGARFGLDRVVWDASHHWATTIDDDDRPDLIVEAVGHQVATLNDAIEAARVGADLYAFGVPDSTHYPIAFQRFFRKLLHLHGGNIQDWKRYLADAEKYLIDHPDLPRDYVTDVFPVDRAQEAFESAVRPAVGRLKVALIPPLI